MSGKGVDLGASVTARLLNQAKERGDDYQIVLSDYCFERFLYRLGVSAMRQRFVLKGAMLLRVWSDHPYRATRDLDLLRRGDGSSEAIAQDIRSIVETDVEDDGVRFAPTELQIEPIRAEAEYVGARVVLPARCGTARLMLQIDVGLGDSVWPLPRTCAYPMLLDSPAPSVLAYPREAVVAEKLEAMIVLGDRNSRIKDFFDLYYLASTFEFDRATLAESVRRSFTRRGTNVPADEPVGLTQSYWNNPVRPAQMRAFLRRSRLQGSHGFDEAFLAVLRAFLLPVLDDLRTEQARAASWLPGKGWS